MSGGTIHLALQGGGSHGAITWGVLDRLLEDERIGFGAVSGTSAGAMNAVVMTDGFHRGGREGARERLGVFWKTVSERAMFSPIQRSLTDRLLGRYTLDTSPGYIAFETATQLFAPHQWNPLGYDPLREVLEEVVDFGNVNCCETMRVHVTATHVRSGRARVFSRGEVTIDAVLASACLPKMTAAVMIEGEAYWDGGFSGNPSLAPLLLDVATDDIMIVKINPLLRDDEPRSAAEISNRVNEISFNVALMKELKTLAALRRAVDCGARIEDPMGAASARARVHLMQRHEDLQDLSASSKMNAEWAYLQELFERGRGWADAWLAEHADDLGQRGTFDVEAWFDKPGWGTG